jgi:hypothetical protein
VYPEWFFLMKAHYLFNKRIAVDEPDRLYTYFCALSGYVFPPMIAFFLNVDKVQEKIFKTEIDYYIKSCALASEGRLSVTGRH